MTTPLDQAPPEIQLAVDLIMLLEQHQLAPPLVLKALAIVTADYQKKAMTMPTSPSTMEEHPLRHEQHATGTHKSD